MRPIVYITAAILATVAGYMAVYSFILPNGKEQTATRNIEPKKASEQITAAVSKEKADGAEKSEKPQNGNKQLIVKPEQGLKGFNTGHMATFVVRQKPQDLPEFEFQDATGASKSMKDWSGKVVLLNLWATWCGPCRKEMPWLDNLKKELGGDDFDMVTISVDRGGIEKPRKFFEDIGLKHLVLYHDKTGRLAGKLRAFGMPTTLLINAEGKEIGRLVGPAEWDSEDALRLLKAAIALNKQGK